MNAPPLVSQRPDGPPAEAAVPAAFADPAVWTRLAEADSDAAFAAAWLTLQCALIGEVRAAVVVLAAGPDGGFRPLAHWPPGSPGNPADHPGLAAVAELAIERRRGAVRQPPADAAPGAAQLDALAWPLLVGDTLHGVIALEIPHATEPRLKAVMRLLQWGAAWWERRLSGIGAGADQAPPRDSAALGTVLEVLAAALDEDRFAAAATAAVTALAVALDCERVAYGTRGGRHTQVRALSHTANFNRKTALIRALGAAMDEAIDQQQTLLLPAPAGAAPQLDRAQRELMERHGARAVCSVPLGHAGRVLGALTLERSDDRPFTPAEVALAEHAGVLLGPVLDARRREDRWIGAKLGASLAWLARALLGPGHLPLKLAALGLLLLGGFFAVATGTYRVHADAALEGTVQRALTAPQDGYIASAWVRAGDRVRKGEPMAALEDKDLRLEKVQWEAEREKFLREYSRALAAGERAQVRILGAQAEQAEARIALLAEQLARVHIAAPFDGIVVSGDLSQALGTPVSRGDMLFEVAPLDSWRVALKVDERDVDALAVGQTGALALAGLPGEPLPVRLTKITPVASAEEGRNLFRAEAVLEALPQSPAQVSGAAAGPAQAAGDAGRLRPGMQGIAKIAVDERSLLWIWTHKLVYWLQLWWWSWWP